MLDRVELAPGVEYVRTADVKDQIELSGNDIQAVSMTGKRHPLLKEGEKEKRGRERKLKVLIFTAARYPYHYGGAYQIGPTVRIKNYIFPLFSLKIIGPIYCGPPKQTACTGVLGCQRLRLEVEWDTWRCLKALPTSFFVLFFSQLFNEKIFRIYIRLHVFVETAPSPGKALFFGDFLFQFVTHVSCIATTRCKPRKLLLRV